MANTKHNRDKAGALRISFTRNQADFGITFDTDVDRVAAVDSQGKEITRLGRLVFLCTTKTT